MILYINCCDMFSKTITHLVADLNLIIASCSEYVAAPCRRHTK